MVANGSWFVLTNINLNKDAESEDPMSSPGEKPYWKLSLSLSLSLVFCVLPGNPSLMARFLKVELVSQGSIDSQCVSFYDGCLPILVLAS